MRSTIGQAGIIGLGVAAAALIIRSTLGASPLHIQLLAVLGAGIVLALVQLALGRSLSRPRRLTATRPPLAPAPAARPRTPEPLADRDSGWTGLAAPIAPPARTTPGETPPTGVQAQPGDPPQPGGPRE
jgi:hypothetical protein